MGLYRSSIQDGSIENPIFYLVFCSKIMPALQARNCLQELLVNIFLNKSWEPKYRNNTGQSLRCFDTSFRVLTYYFILSQATNNSRCHLQPNPQIRYQLCHLVQTYNYCKYLFWIMFATIMLSCNRKACTFDLGRNVSGSTSTRSPSNTQFTSVISKTLCEYDKSQWFIYM